MRYAVLSDIHSNLEALESVLSFVARQAVDRYLVCGDWVGYGANPNECIRRLRSLGAVGVAGNHDWAVCDLFEPSYFNRDAYEAVQWTKNQIGKEEKDYLKSLSLVEEGPDYEIVHGSLFCPEEFHYLMDAREARSHFDRQKTPVSFIGHSHLAGFIYERPDGYVHFDNAPDFAFHELKKKRWKGPKLIVNVGSVGQPRDGDPRASVALFDSTDKKIEIQRVAYDIATAQKKIKEAGLPQRLADRLEEGH